MCHKPHSQVSTIWWTTLSTTLFMMYWYMLVIYVQDKSFGGPTNIASGYHHNQWTISWLVHHTKLCNKTWLAHQRRANQHNYACTSQTIWLYPNTQPLCVYYTTLYSGHYTEVLTLNYVSSVPRKCFVTCWHNVINVYVLLGTT